MRSHRVLEIRRAAIIQQGVLSSIVTGALCVPRYSIIRTPKQTNFARHTHRVSDVLAPLVLGLKAPTQAGPCFSQA